MSKSISKDGGRTTFRAQIKVSDKAENARVDSQCDALILDSKSKSDTIPLVQIMNSQSEVKHEATTGKIDEEKLFYLMSRGLKEKDAKTLIVLGFLSPVAKTLPLEYAVELNRLI
ncbi:MAG: SufD family Fe-S cluster assembly protein, partial [Nanoarchaeota archaeon]